MGDDPFHFLNRNKGAMNSDGFGAALRDEEHVAHPEQLLCAVQIENGARICFRRHLKGNARREVCFDDTRDHIDGRTLRGHDQVYAHRTRHLRQAANRFLDFPGRSEHQVRQFIDDQNHVGQRLKGVFMFEIL
ncbi:hypothetical protein MnTg02_01767 [bacterium MnTg02]|nr:hypothetical protein MnTg02_01767 [bacterium MnTg02]